MSDVSLASANTNYLSGSIKWSGLASGVDFGSVVDQLVEIERLTINRLETWKNTWVEKNKSIQGLDTRMVSLQLNARDLDTFSEFYTRTSSSSDSSVVTAVNTSLTDKGSHTVVVGENIPGQVISKSFLEATSVGGAGQDLEITIDGVTLTVALDATNTADIDALADAIRAANTGASEILQDVTVVEDKTRPADGFGTPGVYKRLVFTAKEGGTGKEIQVSDPTDLSMDENSIDEAFGKTWLGTSTVASAGTYLGGTNKTFTFGVANTGTLGTDDITFNWADNEGNSGSIVVEAGVWNADNDTEFEVLQGVKVKFSAGTVFKDDSFTIDAYSPDLQRPQDKGLAQTEKRVHDGFIDLLTPVHDDAGGAPAEFIYRYAGVETSVSIASDSKLQDLVDAINNDSDNPGVTASIVNDGQGTSQSYHLVLTGKETGAEHIIEVVTSATPLSNFTTDDTAFAVAQRASDAMVKLDGIPTDPSKYIQRPTNTISDVIEGLVLELHNSGQATITVSNDVSAIQDKIEQFVNSINFVLEYIRAETKYNPETGEKGVMLGNYTFDIVRNSLNEILSNSVPGLVNGEDAYTHLSQIGIHTDPDQNGQWVIEESKLSAALKDDLEAVARLFVGDPDHENEASSGIAEQLREKLTALTDDENGIANVLIDNYNGIIKEIDNKILREERRIALVRDRLEQKFARLEALLGDLDGQSKYIESQLEKLPEVGKN